MSYSITSTNYGVYLTNAVTQNPATVVAGAYVTDIFGGDAIFGDSHAAWDLTNLGTVRATGATSSGVYFTFNGTVTNAASAEISGGLDGILIGGTAGTVSNAAGGRISGGAAGILITGDFGTVANSGTISGSGTAGVGVDLYTSKGYVTNAADAVIRGVVNGVTIGSVFGFVGNSGTIQATGTNGNGVYLSSNGGGVTNHVGAQILGVRAGVEIDGDYSIISNFGTISATGRDGVALYARGGEVFNQVGGTILGYRQGIAISAYFATVFNSGTISGTGIAASAGIGVFLPSLGGYVTNNAGATILGNRRGIEIQGTQGARGTVVNSGSVSGTGAGAVGIELVTGGGFVKNNAGGSIIGANSGVFISSTSGYVSNFGTIFATETNSVGAWVSSDGGSVTNNTGGRVFGVRRGVEVDSTLGTVINSGTIAGTGSQSAGVYLASGGGYLTNKAGGVLTGVRYGAFVNNLAGSVSNSGTILGTGASGYGVRIGYGSVVNNASAVIYGRLVGIDVSLAGNVSNSGTVITGTNGIGIYVDVGNVTNSSTGVIQAGGSLATAVVVKYGTFFNSGVLQGKVFGVELSGGSGTAGRKVTLSGTVVGATGVSVAPGNTASQTVSVAGLVTGTSGTAVSLGGGNNRLILSPGAVFQGKVDGGGGKSVVEVATSPGGATAAGDGSATVYVDLGSVTNFSALQVDPSAALDAGGTLSFDILVNQGRINLAAGDSLAVGTVAAAAGAGTIDLKSGGAVHFSGAVAANQTVLFRPPGGSVVIDHPEQFAASMTEFAASDLIDLPLGTASFQQYAGGILSFAYGGGSVGLQLSTSYATPQFFFGDDGHGGTGITVSDAVCFCRGARILTERGEVPVEDLKVGEQVVTLSGAVKPIVWIGIGRDLVTRANKLARPVIVRRGALAEDIPHRDLYLTHGHALYFDGAMIPVENLINHHSILWDESARVVEYYHIELADHDVVLANGAPAETYYDANNRAQFHNTRAGSAAGPAKPPCGSVLNGGDIVEAVWARLLARAGRQRETATSDDPDLHLVVDGARLDPTEIAGTAYTFALTAPPSGDLRLRSRSGVPSLLGINRHDHRRLGVALRCIELCEPGILTRVDHDAPLFAAGGCHEPESGYCWTDGECVLPAPLFAHLTGPATLIVHTERPGLRYPIPAPVAAAA